MIPFTIHVGIAAPLPRANIDTDQIIPVHFLKRLTRAGYEDGLFYGWRSDPDFVLNRPNMADASVLVAGPDFGIGSSREHAVWALLDRGIRAVISPSFADIFRGNALGNGLLPVEAPADFVDGLFDVLSAEPREPVRVDLENQTVEYRDVSVPFTVDPYHRARLLRGQDEIAATYDHISKITAYESTRHPSLPVLDGPAGPA